MISGTVFPAFRSFLTFLMVSGTTRGLASEPHASISRFGDTVHLTLAPNQEFS